MAFITISTNQPISPEQQTEIVQAFGKVVACVPNQSAQSILISFEQKTMWYQDNRPVALVQFRTFGNATHTGYPELTSQISHILHRTLGIASGLVFVEFCNITAFGVGDFYAEQ